MQISKDEILVTPEAKKECHALRDAMYMYHALFDESASTITESYKVLDDGTLQYTLCVQEMPFKHVMGVQIPSEHWRAKGEA